jgi:hypothetical protein
MGGGAGRVPTRGARPPTCATDLAAEANGREAQAAPEMSSAGDREEHRSTDQGRDAWRGVDEPGPLDGGGETHAPVGGVTRQNYLDLAYLGAPPEELGEEERYLPEKLRADERQ